MKKYYLILVMGIIFISCQKEEIVEVENSEVEIVEQEIVELETQGQEVDYEEYFRAEVDGVVYEMNDPELIKGTVYPSRNSGVINFDFTGGFYDPTKEVDFYKEFNFKVCFYDGPGTYYTGTPHTASWAYVWFDYQYWENHYEYGNEPGEVIVTSSTNDYVEGTFEYKAYNEYLETTIHVKGEFGLILETPENYND